MSDTITKAALTSDQQAYVAIANALKAAERSQVRLTLIGVAGIAMVGLAAIILRRRG
jgi:hypothetical protein